MKLKFCALLSFLVLALIGAYGCSQSAGKTQTSGRDVQVSPAQESRAQEMAKPAVGSGAVTRKKQAAPIYANVSGDSPQIRSNAVQNVGKNPVSTLSVDVDTAGYSIVRAYLDRGQLPPASTVRVEEMINYFSYNYPAPSSPEEPISLSATLTECPWNNQTKLLHLGLKGYNYGGKRPPLNLVFLVDVSGSMLSEDRLELLKKSLNLMVDDLAPMDRVALVTYAGSAGVALEPTGGEQKSKIKAAINKLEAGGSTAGEAGLDLAYKLAQKNFQKNSVNRVIIGTDGDFNVGTYDTGGLEKLISEKRKTGIYLSVLLVGSGNMRDSVGQALAQKGNGVAAYIDTLEEGRRFLVENMSQSNVPIADDVKIQVEFNPAQVAQYRLVGYETRLLNEEDFKNDKVDAGDMGNGQVVTAIYEITPVGTKTQTDLPDRRYQQQDEVSAYVAPSLAGEVAHIKIRYKVPGQKSSRLLARPIHANNLRPLAETSGDVRFAVAMALFGQKLSGSDNIGRAGYDDAIKLAKGALDYDPGKYRAQSISLMQKAKKLGR